MALSAQTIKTVYIPNGKERVFALSFQLFSPHDLECLHVDTAGRETRLTNFSTEGFGTDGGVYVRFALPPPAGKALVIRRRTKHVQESAYPEGGKFPSVVIERDLDRIVGMIQELDEAVGRAIKINSAEENPKPAEEFYTDMRDFADAADSSAKRAEAAATIAQAAVPAITAAGTAEVARVRREGQAWTEAACQCASKAADSAEAARRLVQSIEGIEAAQYTINALSIVDGQLVWSQGQSGASMRSNDYDWVSGPEAAPIYYTLNNAGEAVRHIPVTIPA